MGTIIFILLAIAVLSAIKVSPPKGTSGELTDARRRQHRRRQSTEPHGLPWMDPNYQKRKERKRDSYKF